MSELIVDFNHNEAVFACDMRAIDPGQREEHMQNARQLVGKVQGIEERPDGYTLKLPLETLILLKADQFIALERLCCPFFRFTVEIEPAASSFWVGLAGPPGIKPFIEAELGLNPQTFH